MKTFYRRYFSDSSVFSVGVGAVLATLLGAGCSTPTDNPTDGGVQDHAATSGPITLTTVIPGLGPLAGKNSVTIVGTGFTDKTTVTFGTKLATGVQLLSKTQLSVSAPESTTGLGPVAVTVKNPDGSMATQADAYSYYRVQVALKPAISVAAGTNPVALIATDLNADGNVQIVTANEASNNVSVLSYNNTWNSGIAYPAGISPTSLVAADFNNNGRPDIAVAFSNATGNDVAILSDNGGIGFMAAVNLKVAQNVVGIDARDLNGDGKIDLVAAVRSTGMAYVLVNSTSGLNPTFTTGNNFAIGSSPSAVVLSDMDGDGKVDLVATSYNDSTVSVLLGLGNGNFGVAKVAATGMQPIALALGDLNRDTKPDVVTANFNTKQVSVLLSQGDGSLPTLRSLAAGSKPRSVVVADLDNDGNRDLIIANSGDDTVMVLLGRGDGTFDPGQSFPVGSQPMAVVVADLNKDGKLDVATANYNSNDVSILYNQMP